MKKSIAMILALVCAAQTLSAIPARPDKFTRTLPNGKKVTLQLHGDEFCHWMTDASGSVVREDAKGNIVPSSMAEVKVRMGGGNAVNRDRMKRIEKTKRMMRKAAPTRSSDGSIHFPMILVQFSDLRFQVAETDNLVWEAFNRLANEVGYGDNGGTGSIHDFYVDNTMGQTDFYFDVFGPVTVSGTYADYGADKQSEVTDYCGEPAADALMEAVRILAEEKGSDIFNPYDNDGDGWVDAVFMYYAGHNQAEGGPEDSIWPHEWTVDSHDYFFGTHYSEEVYGNVRFGTYSCSSELKGGSGVNMCGIGTAVHEFGHALGLPDFYDTNNNKYGDGKCGGLYIFSPMCSGSYNNGGRTPSCFTMEERVMMGWAADFEPMPASGAITIPALSTYNTAYKEETANPGEYFVFECRNGRGWDREVPTGMVVYHVDRSRNEVTLYTGPGEYYTTVARYVWEGNGINTNLEHPCYYVVPAANQKTKNYIGNVDAIPFPGFSSVKTYQWKGWASENRQDDIFYDISFDFLKGEVTMLRDGAKTAVGGKVFDMDGKPVTDATVSVYAEYRPATVTRPSQNASAGGPARIARRIGNPLQTGRTDEYGAYKIDLEDLELSGEVTLEVSAPGYLSKVEHVTLRDKAITIRDFGIRRVGEPASNDLTKYDGNENVGVMGFGTDEFGLRMAAIHFSAEELAYYVGKKIIGLDFVFSSTDEDLPTVKGVIDFGDVRRIVKEVPDAGVGSWCHLDLSEEDIRIPEETDCYFGYALLGGTTEYPYFCCYRNSVPGGLLLYQPMDSSEEVPEEVEWWDYSEGYGFGPLLISVELEGGISLQFNYIANSSAGTYAVGQTLDLNLVRVDNDHAPGTDVSWYFDDEPVSGEVTFTRAGRHTLEARFTTVAGRRKIVELEITVE